MAPVTELIFGCQILVRKCTLRNKVKQIIIALKPHMGQMDAKPVYSNLYNTKVREEKITNTELYGNLLKVLEHTFTVKPVVRLRATLQYSHAMLVF